MKIIRPILTLIGALTVAGMLATAVLFFFAPALLQKEDVLEKADAIVVLGGHYYRPLYAADLYNKGYAPQILASRPVVTPEIEAVRDLGISFPYQWELFRDVLLKKGVPENKIKFFGKANFSTLDEAEKLRKDLSPQIKSIILVTSPLHTRRAGTIFREILPPQIKITVVGTPYEKVPDKWWTNFRSAPFVVLEVIKTIYYELGGAMSNSEQTTAG
ncbi:YdcF family protein [Maridesulfovibrio sp.]|uniref:YdcF family protein n=1 Tax=Maridesulfovibrio sp. TaxID=2795000 RepID=UPI002AA71D27|nr:YdcF family protein [Maridesulfovibrio sp.]